MGRRASPRGRAQWRRVGGCQTRRVRQLLRWEKASERPALRRQFSCVAVRVPCSCNDAVPSTVRLQTRRAASRAVCGGGSFCEKTAQGEGGAGGQPSGRYTRSKETAVCDGVVVAGERCSGSDTTVNKSHVGNSKPKDGGGIVGWYENDPIKFYQPANRLNEDFWSSSTFGVILFFPKIGQ